MAPNTQAGAGAFLQGFNPAPALQRRGMRPCTRTCLELCFTSRASKMICDNGGASDPLASHPFSPTPMFCPLPHPGGATNLLSVPSRTGARPSPPHPPGRPDLRGARAAWTAGPARPRCPSWTRAPPGPRRGARGPCPRCGRTPTPGPAGRCKRGSPGTSSTLPAGRAPRPKPWAPRAPGPSPPLPPAPRLWGRPVCPDPPGRRGAEPRPRRWPPPPAACRPHRAAPRPATRAPCHRPGWTGPAPVPPPGCPEPPGQRDAGSCCPQAPPGCPRPPRARCHRRWWARAPQPSATAPGPRRTRTSPSTPKTRGPRARASTASTCVPAAGPGACG